MCRDRLLSPARSRPARHASEGCYGSRRWHEAGHGPRRSLGMTFIDDLTGGGTREFKISRRRLFQEFGAAGPTAGAGACHQHNAQAEKETSPSRESGEVSEGVGGATREEEHR